MPGAQAVAPVVRRRPTMVPAAGLGDHIAKRKNETENRAEAHISDLFSLGRRWRALASAWVSQTEPLVSAFQGWRRHGGDPSSLFCCLPIICMAAATDSASRPFQTKPGAWRLRVGGREKLRCRRRRTRTPRTHAYRVRGHWRAGGAHAARYGRGGAGGGARLSC
jgi:hypothetical protein